jgi:transposase
MTMPSMPLPALPGQSGSAAGEVVLGVDTHKEVHAAAVVTALGALLAARTFPATAAGYRDLVSWARSLGPLQRAGVECTGSYGAALARHLRSEGVAVVEVSQPDRATRRRRGKTDASTPSPLPGPCSPARPRQPRKPATGRSG